MNIRRFIVSIVLLCGFFLGLYTWNQKTDYLDTLSAHLGLESAGVVLRVKSLVVNSIVSIVETERDINALRSENEALRAEIQNFYAKVNILEEGQRELERLRDLLLLSERQEWEAVASSILAWRIGSNDFLESVMLSNGYFNGAAVGTPVVSHKGLVGRVFRAGPYTSTTLLLTDPGSHVAVRSSDSRVAGIVQGGGAQRNLSLLFVKYGSTIKVGEYLFTSGLDRTYPKGIPVGRVVKVQRGSNMMLDVEVEPSIDFANLEEVLLLQNPYDYIDTSSSVYSPRPETSYLPAEQYADDNPHNVEKEQVYKEHIQGISTDSSTYTQ